MPKQEISYGWDGRKFDNTYPDPFMDMSSSHTPVSVSDVLKLSEFVWLKVGLYRTAATRIARYFLTSYSYEGLDDENVERLDNFLNNQLGMRMHLASLGDNFLCYGNVFRSIIIPFRRWLRCEECSRLTPIDRVDYTFKKFVFKAHCPNCKRITIHQKQDRRHESDEGIRIKAWNPHEIELREHPYTGETEYRWRIPEKLIQEVKRGNPFVINDLPWAIIEAVRDGKLFKFHPGVMFHYKESPPDGVKAGGWGISRMLASFCYIWYSQMLYKANEVLASDFALPWRVLSPPESSPVSDPILRVDMSNFKSAVSGMVKARQRDPASVHVSPIAFTYQTLGGEANALATNDLLNQATEAMLSSFGVPLQLHRGDLTVQGAPMALRMFAQIWPQVTALYSDFGTWVADILTSVKHWDKPTEVKMDPPTLADDIELRHIWLQLSAANIISKRTAFEPFNLNVKEETRRVFQEQADMAEAEQEFQEDMMKRQELTEMLQMAQQGGMPPGGMPPGGMPPGGMPPPGMGMGGMPMLGDNMTPQEMSEQARAMAQQLLQRPYEERRRKLMQIKKGNPTLHAIVKQHMEDMRGQAASEGKQMLLGGGPPM